MTTSSKGELYRTARIKNHVFTHDGETDLEAGQYVAVQFVLRAWNQLYRREESVYSITTGGKVWGMMYASNLTEFCL